MAPSSRSVDDPENIRRFLDYANASKKGAKDASSVSANSLPAAAAAASAPSATETKQDVHNGHTAANGGAGPNSAIQTGNSSPVAPELNPYTAGIPKEFWALPSSPNTTSSGSPSGQFRPSPHLSGLIAPTNSPQAKAALSHSTVSDSHNEDVEGGVSLNESKSAGQALDEPLGACKTIHHPRPTDGGNSGRGIFPSEGGSVNDSQNDSSLSKSHCSNAPPFKMVVSHTPTNSESSQGFKPTGADRDGAGSRGRSSSGMRDDVQVTDFAKPAINIANSSTTKKQSVLPHLRGRQPITEPTGPTEPKTESEENQNSTVNLAEEHIVEATESAEPTAEAFLETSEMTPQEQPPVVDNDTDAVAVQSHSSIVTAGRATALLLFDAIEATGYLSAEGLALLRQARQTIDAPNPGRPESADMLPAKTYKDPTRPLEKHLIIPASPIKTDPESWTKSAPGDPKGMHTSTTSSSPAKEQVPFQDASDIEKPTPNVETSIEKSSDPPDIFPTKPKLATNAPAVDANATVTELANKTNASNDTFKTDNDNREHKVYFESWGKRQERDAPAAKIRKVIITDLPANSSFSTVAGLVFGGPLEDIVLRTSSSGVQSASVRFINAQDCELYYDETSNGIVYGKDTSGRELVSFVKLAKDVDVVGGLLRTWLEQGATRCVRAVGVDEDWGADGLKKLAGAKGRMLEGITDTTTPGGSRTVMWRFCKIEHAVQFKATLARDEEWEHTNIQFAPDPCAIATGVHLHD